MNLNKNSTANSPCVRNCCLSEKDVCLGCFRHINEIVGWQAFTEQEKIDVLEMCTKRKYYHSNNLDLS